ELSTPTGGDRYPTATAPTASSATKLVAATPTFALFERVDVISFCPQLITRGQNLVVKPYEGSIHNTRIGVDCCGAHFADRLPPSLKALDFGAPRRPKCANRGRESAQGRHWRGCAGAALRKTMM